MKSLSIIDQIEIYRNNINLAKSSLKLYTNVFKHFVSYLAKITNENVKDIYLDKIYLLKDSNGYPIKYLPIDSSILDEYFLTLVPKGYYPLAYTHAALMSLFTFLERNYNLNNPMSNMEFRVLDYIPDEKIVRILTRREIIKFFDTLISNSKHLEDELILFTLLLTTGCRISEILNIKSEDIDFNNDSFIIRKSKNRTQRIINMQKGMGNLLKIYLSSCIRTDKDYLFINSKSKKVLTREKVNNLLVKYLSMANLQPMRIHGFRHTFATLMAEEEIPLEFIKQLLGHKSLTSTKRYINPHFIRNKDITISENEVILNSVREKLGF